VHTLDDGRGEILVRAEDAISIGRARSPNYYLVMRVEVDVPMSALRQDSSSTDSSGALRTGE
jgi:hypothetical protein